MRVNMGKTKVMRCRDGAGQVVKSGKYPRSDMLQQISLGNGQSLNCVDKFCYWGDMIAAGVELKKHPEQE